MQITEINFKDSPDSGPVIVYFSITFNNCLVIHDLKLINGNKGIFVAFPTNKKTFRCENCQKKNIIGCTYCGSCGEKLPIIVHDGNKYNDIVFPVTFEFRNYVEKTVKEAWDKQK